MKNILILGLLATMPTTWAEDLTKSGNETNFPPSFIEPVIDRSDPAHKGTGDLDLKSYGSGFYNSFVPASAAAPDDSSAEYTYSGAGCINTTGAGGLFYLNTYLPDGHEIMGIRYYYDDTSTGSSTVTLFQMAGDGTNTVLGAVTSTGDTGFGSIYETLDAGNHVVDNSNGAYVLRFQSTETNSAQQMCGVRYQMSNP